MPRIDDEFKGLIPPLSAEEYGQLEENLTEYGGARDPLVVWGEADILLDGHNRLEICERLGLPYAIAEISLPDRDAAADWIDKNQLGRRNLRPDIASMIRGRCYNRQKKAPYGRADRDFSGDHFDTPKTADRLAEQFGVSPATMKRDGQFAAAVESLKPVIPDIETRVMAGDVPSKKAVMETAQTVKALQDGGMPVDEIKRQFYETTNAAQPVAVTMFSSESNEYYTPAVYIEAARELMGAIDLDPATCPTAQAHIQAVCHFTEQDDGLAHEWGGRVWLNPPYGKIGNESSQGVWGQKLIAEHKAGRVTEGVLLVRAAVGYEWFELLWDVLPVCFARERLSFIRADGNDDGQSKQGTAFFYVGNNLEKFKSVFGRFGRVFV